MEPSKPSQGCVDGANGAAGGGGGAFANRRQKNLEKFRRHKAAVQHRHTSSSDAIAGPVVETRLSKEGCPPQAVVVEEKTALTTEHKNSKPAPTKPSTNKVFAIKEEKSASVTPKSPTPATVTTTMSSTTAARPRAEEVQQTASSPHNPNKRRADIIKSLKHKTKHRQQQHQHVVGGDPAPKSPKSPASASPSSSPISVNCHESTCSASSAITEQHENLTRAPSLSMTDSSDYQGDEQKQHRRSSSSGDCGGKPKTMKFLLKMKPTTTFKGDVFDDNDNNQANENAQSDSNKLRVPEKVNASKPSSEEALKPKTNNNRLKARRNFHKKKFGKDTTEKGIRDDKTTPTKGVNSGSGQPDNRNEPELENVSLNQVGLSGVGSADINMKETSLNKDAYKNEPGKSSQASQETSTAAITQPNVSQSSPAGSTAKNDANVPSSSKEKVTTTGNHDIRVAQQESSPRATTTDTCMSCAEATQPSSSNFTNTDDDDSSPAVATQHKEAPETKSPENGVPQATESSFREGEEVLEKDLEATDVVTMAIGTPGPTVKSPPEKESSRQKEEPEPYQVGTATNQAEDNKTLAVNNQDINSTAKDSKEQTTSETTTARTTTQASTPQNSVVTAVTEEDVPKKSEDTSAVAEEYQEEVDVSNSIQQSIPPTTKPDNHEPEAGADNTSDKNVQNNRPGSQDQSQEGFEVDFGENNFGKQETALKEPHQDTEETEKDQPVRPDKPDLKVDVEGWEKVNVSTDKDTPQSDMCETSRSFDLRSIHEFPPEHIKDADSILHPHDPSWDTAQVFFTKRQQPGSTNSKGEPMLNLFETTTEPVSPWAFGPSNDFFEGGNSFSEVFEEKKELDKPTPLQLHLDSNSNKKAVFTEPMDSPSSLISPRRRLSRERVKGTATEKSFGFDVSNLAADSTDELDKKDTKGEIKGENKEAGNIADDDENLLGDTATTGDGSWENEVNISKEERLQIYTANLNESDSSSVGSSNGEEEEDSFQASGDGPAVEYMFQPEGANNDEESRHIEEEEMPAELVEEGTQLVLSAEAAEAAEADVSGSTVDVSEQASTSGADSAPAASPASCATPTQTAEEMNPITSLSVSNSSSEDSKPVLAEDYISNSSSSCSASSSSKCGGECVEDTTIHDKDPKEAEAESNNEEDASTKSNSTSEDEKEGPPSTSEPLDLEESASLVGVSLVPSFGGNPNRAGTSTSGQSKARDGIPPRGSLSPSMLPPPPPPPLGKKKRRKKKGKQRSSRKGKRALPPTSPPPEEKLREWQATKNRPLMHLGVVKESHMEGSQDGQSPSKGNQVVEEIVCGAFNDAEMAWDGPAESPRHIKLACGNFPEEEAWTAALGANMEGGDLKCGGPGKDITQTVSRSDPNVCGLPPQIANALAMAGLQASPQASLKATSPKPPPKHGSAAPSPVDAARSIALENAMRRASKGLSARFDFPSPAKRTEMESKSLFENETAASTSMGSSISMEEEETRSVPSQAGDAEPEGKVVEPPPLNRQEPNISRQSAGHAKDKPMVFLHELTSPSLSMSPSKEEEKVSKSVTQASTTTSPLIHDSKMAQKAALASYAAAVTFEEQYASSLSRDASTVDGIEHSNDCDTDAGKEATGMPSLFCAPGLGDDAQQRAAGETGAQGLPEKLFQAAENLSKQEIDFSEIMEGKSEILKGLMTAGGGPSSPSRDRPDEVQGLQRGAFSPWRNAMYARSNSVGEKDDGTFSQTLSVPTIISSTDSIEKLPAQSAAFAADRELVKTHQWLLTKVLNMETQPAMDSASDEALRDEITSLLNEDENLNKLCIFIAEEVNIKIRLENEERAQRNGQLSPRKAMRPFQLSMRLSGQKSASVVAANFVSFIHRISKASGVDNPFGEDNPFVLDLVGTSITNGSTPPPTPPSIVSSGGATMQKIVFGRCTADKIVKFCVEVCGGFGDVEEEAGSVPEVDAKKSGDSSFDPIEASRAANPSPTKKSKNPFFGSSTSQADDPFVIVGERKLVVSPGYPSPFEGAVEQSPQILKTILGILGDPVTVCRLKMMNRNCRDYIAKNEQLIMRDAVRAGGLSMNLRPSFWLWVILEKCGKDPNGDSFNKENSRKCLLGLEERGRQGKWHNVIQRDVARAFGNMPPHKTGARIRTDSIVRALVTWGKNRIMKRGVKGDGNPPPTGSNNSSGDSTGGSDASQTPTDTPTVSDWGGVSPVASFTGSVSGGVEGEGRSNSRNNNEDGRSGGGSRRSGDSESIEAELLVLSGNALTEEMKADLQGKLAFILHALAAQHEDVGYCQGMDYVVAHLLRILQDTVCWRAATGTLPASVHSTRREAASINKKTDADSVSQEVMDEMNKTLVVEDTVFQVMDCFFTTYNLQHMYWPELRCLKTCCKVFERLIQLKLPVLADHFEHHELNVGLFALGWFQTLFLYLPSMPSATVCHMWDIWLVERSFKIFFRVGTAILFLSQPTLLNHELEGMQIYLNTFPDATLLNPDILIACALQIKVTNKMLMDIEKSL